MPFDRLLGLYAGTMERGAESGQSVIGAKFSGDERFSVAI